MSETLAPEAALAAAGGRSQRIKLVHPPTLRESLSIEAWSQRDIAEPERLLGDLVSRTSRTFLVGTTGLGKTMFGLAMACGIASGDGFLHWRSAKPARVLYVDGEMPAELIKARSLDALRRGQGNVEGRLSIFARDMEDQFAADFPDVGKAAPLNTPAGHEFIARLIDRIGGVDVVVFDNVMSLLAGDQREEVPWSDTIPLVEKLTKDRIGQVWLDHTGHNSSRQYGSSTKAWRFDSVGIMEPMPEDQRSRRELAFKLSFDAPGKARRRTPENWRDFEPCTIRLAQDVWTSEFADGEGPDAKLASKEAKLKDSAAILLREARLLLADHGEVVSPGAGFPAVLSVTRDLLRARLIDRGWFPETLLCKDAESKTKLDRKGYQHEWNGLNTLKRKGLCTFNNVRVWSL